MRGLLLSFKGSFLSIELLGPWALSELLVQDSLLRNAGKGPPGATQYIQAQLSTLNLLNSTSSASFTNEILAMARRPRPVKIV